jgi:uncharacterized protein YraI
MKLIRLAMIVALAGCSVAQADEDESAVTRAEAEVSPVIRFDAGYRQSVAGVLTRGKAVRVQYDASRLTTCRGEQGGIPQWSITGYYTVGDSPVRTFGAGGLALRNGDPTTLVLDRAGTLKIWFENNNRWGCQAWDSAFGENYRFEVAPAAADPGWMGNVRYAINRMTCDGAPCASTLLPFTSEITYETYARQRAAIRVVQFDVWKAGVTDRDDPELWKKLDVRVYSRVVGAPTFTQRWVSFDRRVGNDARYSIDLRELDSLPDVRAGGCPAYPITKVNDAYVEAPVEFYVSVNGVELRPPSGTWRVRYQNYLDGYRACVR